VSDVTKFENFIVGDLETPGSVAPSRTVESEDWSLLIPRPGSKKLPAKLARKLEMEDGCNYFITCKMNRELNQLR
jgi:hypothetical protein